MNSSRRPRTSRRLPGPAPRPRGNRRPPAAPRRRLGPGRRAARAGSRGSDPDRMGAERRAPSKGAPSTTRVAGRLPQDPAPRPALYGGVAGSAMAPPWPPSTALVALLTQSNRPSVGRRRPLPCSPSSTRCRGTSSSSAPRGVPAQAGQELFAGHELAHLRRGEFRCRAVRRGHAPRAGGRHARQLRGTSPVSASSSNRAC